MKITLKNLAKATAQQVFDQVAAHLLKQGVRSAKNIDGEPYCSYRAIKHGLTLKCAAGCLIAKSEYKADFEDVTWGGLVKRGLVPGNNDELITDLQKIHDNVDIESWRYELKGLAKDHKLNLSVLETV